MRGYHFSRHKTLIHSPALASGRILITLRPFGYHRRDILRTYTFMRPWYPFREHYRREFKAAQERDPTLTQMVVAERAGLFGRHGKPAQNTISKILGDEDYTPRFDTFLLALHGLGLTFEEFQRRMKTHTEHVPIAPAPRAEISLLVPNFPNSGQAQVIPMHALADAIHLVLSRATRGTRAR